MLETAAIRAALDRVVDPCSIATGLPLSLAEMGMVQEIRVENGDVEVVLRLTSPICWQAANIIAKVEDILSTLPGSGRRRCTIDASADWMPDMMDASARRRLRAVRPLPNEVVA